jgi:alpha-galactosidase
MVNPRSELFIAHPDWVVRDEREPREHRQQLALDPLNDEVVAFEAGVFERVLDGNPGISYLKWDANRPITDPGSRVLGTGRQSNLWVDNVNATWALMDEVVARHPAVELMLCASGGGRNDHGTLRRFHEFWTSDNTDPLLRVRMQWACSHFFPASVMAAHVTRWGQRPVEFACAVALSGRFGFDIDLEDLSEDEHNICRRAVAVAHRTTEVVQQGEIEHIISPLEGDDRSRSAVAYHSGDGARSVLFAYQLEEATTEAPFIHLGGIDGARTYELTCTDLTTDQPLTTFPATGAELGAEGLQWPLTTPCTARIWELTAI